MDQGYTFKFIKAVSDTVFYMINAVYHDKPLWFFRGCVAGETRLASSGNERNQFLPTYAECRLETMALTKKPHLIGRSMDGRSKAKHRSQLVIE